MAETASTARSAALATGLNAIGAILPQVVSLVLLPATAYAQFSMVYLVYAAGASSVFSVICDAWTRTWTGRTPLVGWRHFSTALVRFSAAFGIVALGVGALVGIGALNAALGALAAATLVHRTGSRYYESHVGDWRHVLRGDMATIVGASLVLALGIVLAWEPTALAFGAWAAGSVASVAGSRRPHLAGTRSLRRWWVVHRRAIKPLLGDSLLLDAGSIGTPYVLAPILGLTNFGVYRAVANVGIPVQLALNPLRPIVSRTPASRLLSARLMIPYTVALLLAGGACYAILVALPLLPFRLGVLSELHQVALPASLFVPANGFSFLIYLVARSHAPAARILPARIAQTVLAIAGPVTGAIGWGLHGAVWGFSGSALLFAAIWWITLLRPRSR